MIISPTGLIAQVSLNGLTPAGRRPGVCFHSVMATLCLWNRPVAAPEWLGKVRLSWQNEAFSRGQMRVEARHPAGEWLPLSPAAPLPAPQTHYQWRWTPLNVASIDQPLTFSFSAGTLARSDELAQYGIIHDPHASSRLMIVEESEDTLALAEKVIAALTASAAGLIVVTRRAWRVEENEALSASHHALWALLRVAANEQPERLLAAIDLAENPRGKRCIKG